MLVVAPHLTQIRSADSPSPLPNASSPEDMTSEYAVGDQVEFLYNGEWRPGTISGEGGSSSGAKIYTVMTSQAME